MPQSDLSKTIKKYMTLENIIFVIILSSIVLYVGAQYYIFHTSDPQVAVTTTSMVPTYEGFDLTANSDFHPHQYYDILRGDLLILENIEPHVGDVVVFNASMSSGGRCVNNPRSVDCITPVVHRLVAERVVNGKQEFDTKGDHNPYSDALSSGNDFGWIYRSAIIGVVVLAIHHAGWFALQLQSNFTRILLGVGIVAIVLYTIWDSLKPEKKESEEEKKDEQDSKKRKVYLKIKKVHIRINRPTLSFLFIVGVLFMSYMGVGLVNMTTHQNTVQWLPTGSEETNNIINLRDGSTHLVERFGTDVFYNTLIRINSSGTLNYVHKLLITVVYDNASLTTVKNQAYVWTIVYDYAGSKLIHALFKFTVPSNMSNIAVKTTIKYELYSTGLQASAPYTMSQNVTVLM